MTSGSEAAKNSGGQLGRLAVLGSTGSIGRQTLQVVRDNPSLFSVAALAAHSAVEEVVAQAREFHPEFVALADEQAAARAKAVLGAECRVGAGDQAVREAAALASVHTVVCAVVGFAGFSPLLAAIAAGKHVALANKESIVAAGPLVKAALRTSTSVVVPVDSEHNSVFQCLLGRGRGAALRKVVLTASGGPFLHHTAEELAHVTPASAVAHPRWSMGQKISVDSATLMNKGLEVIEAAMLFDLRAEQIEVLIHPQSLVHGLAEYADGTLLAALFETDMRVPIAFALSFLRSNDPKSTPGTAPVLSAVPFLDLAAKKELHFFAPDYERFPALRLCQRALEQGGTTPAVLSAANEIAVYAFLNQEIPFTDITEVVKEVIDLHCSKTLETLNDVMQADAWARECASYVKLNARLHGRACAAGNP